MPSGGADYLSDLLTHLQQVVEQLPAAVYVCEAPSGVIRLYNRRAAGFWGRAPKLGDTDERFCGAFRLFRVDGRLLPHAETPMAQALLGGSAHDEEVVIERPDGSRVPVRVNIAPLRDPGGQIVGAINTFQDIADLKQAEGAARLAAIVATADDAIISKTLDGVVTTWNHAAERMFGYSEAEIVGKSITTIIPPERLPEEEDFLRRMRRGETIEHFETERVRKDGQRIAISVTVSPVRGLGGHIVGASKIARDISERRQSEGIRARLAAIVDSSSDVIVSKTLDGIITSWNPSAERIFGWTSQEAVGRHITLIVPDDRHAEEEDVLARIARGERVDHFETVRKAKDGRLVDMSITVSPVRDAAGRVIGASKVARDITDRRRLEEERAHLFEREQEARLQAESLSRTKDHLLATVSHELRTPLNSVFGWARMMQTSPLDEATRARGLEVIVRSASAQARLVEDLLDLSRIITGRMRLEFQTVDLNAVITAALDTVGPAARVKGIVLMTTLDRSLAPISGAPDRLQQVVWNLVMNAVKFSGAGTYVQITSRRVANAAEVVVADVGEGIAAEVLAHVFEPFRQEDSSSTRAHGGLGLGLALVRQLVEAHGGSVRAESPGKGRGATFTVTLPCAPSSTTVDLPRAGRAADRTSAPVTLQGTRVLVIDDDPEALDMTGMMLRIAGAEVRTAGSAFVAHSIVDAWQPHVVLTDLAMPGEDGFMVLAAIRETFNRHGSKVPIIAVTAYASAENRQRAMDAGFDLYLTKPVDPAILTDAVAEFARRIN